MKNKIEKLLSRNKNFENATEEHKEKIKSIIEGLIGLELSKLGPEKHKEIMDKMEKLEEAEMETEELIHEHDSTCSHGVKFGVAELVLLVQNKNCPSDFMDFFRDYGKDAEPEESENIEKAEYEFLMGLSADERKKLAEERHSKPMEEYYLEYLVEHGEK